MTKVSVIVPCLNEEGTITLLLDAIYAQHYSKSEIEVVIADGLSADSTRARIKTFSEQHPDLEIRVVDNPSRAIPVGLNLAIAASRHEYIVRLDAHCVPYKDYIARCMEALQAGRGWNVGGVWEIRPGAEGWMAEAIAVAAAHPLGVGDALYRYTSRAGEVDTVPFGAFKRELIAKIGGFDESLHSNEDYEFNVRVRQHGGKVWLDPAIRSVYFARPTLGQLSRQYLRYGYWKYQMLRRYPGSLRWRQAIPPLFVLSLLVILLAALLLPWLWWVLAVELLSYAALLLGAALLKALELKQIQLSLGVPLAMATMHLAWGAGFLISLAGLAVKKA